MILAVIVIVLVLLHSGKDAGLSGAFGVGTGAGPFGGGSLVERNLNRWTIFFATLFAVNVLVLLKIYLASAGSAGEAHRVRADRRADHSVREPAAVELAVAREPLLA